MENHHNSEPKKEKAEDSWKICGRGMLSYFGMRNNALFIICVLKTSRATFNTLTQISQYYCRSLWGTQHGGLELN